MSSLNSHRENPALATLRAEREIVAQWNSERRLPVVSIICHTYNHCNYLTSALNSFLMQETEFPFEIIVHDDASIDGTAEIINEYTEQFPHIIKPIFQSKNQFRHGRWPSKFTFPKARGEFIALCEGDDYWIDTKKLDKQVTAIRCSPQVDISFHPTRVENASGKTWILGDYGTTSTIVPVGRAIEKTGMFSGTASLIFRTKAALDLPYWFFESSDRPYPLYDFFLEIILGRFGLLYVPGVMAAYRRGVPESWTAKHARRSNTEALRDHDIMVRYLNRLSDYSEISAEAIEHYIRRDKKNYAKIFWVAGYFEGFRHVLDGLAVDLTGGERLIYSLAGRYKCFFIAVHWLNKQKNDLKRKFVNRENVLTDRSKVRL